MFIRFLTSVLNWSKNKMFPRTTVSPKGFHSSVANSSPRSKIPRPTPPGWRRWEKSKQKVAGLSDEGPGAYTVPAHLCLPVSLSFHLSFLLFPFSLSRPQAQRLPRLLYSLCLCAVLYRVFSIRCQEIHAYFSITKWERELDVDSKESFIFNLEENELK